MKKQSPLRLRNTHAPRPFMDQLEPRLFLSSSHLSPLALPHAVTTNIAPASLKLALKKGIIIGAFKDKGKTDTHTISIDWGDGQTTPLSLNAGIIKFQIPEHTYSVAGAYTATFTVTDSANATTSANIILALNDRDLVPSLKSAPNIDASIITGQPTTASISVSLTNFGFSDVPAGTGTVSIFLRPTGGGSDVNITTTPAPIPLVKASITQQNQTTHQSKTTHQTKSVDVDISIPTTLAPGTYSIVVVVSDGENSTHANNNTLVVPDFTITAALGTISVSTDLTIPGLPTTIVAGTSAKGKLTLNFANSGNLPTTAIQQYDVFLYLRPTSGSASDVDLITLPDVKIPVVKADSNQTVSTNLTLPPFLTSQVPPGTYTLNAVLTPVNGTPGSAFTVQDQQQFTFNASSNTGGAVLKHGDTLQCTCNTQLTGSDFLELGSFSTNAHTNGNYRFTNFGITITYANNETDSLGLIAFTSAQTFLDPSLDGNPTKITFSTDPTGAFASFLLNATTTIVYAKMG